MAKLSVVRFAAEPVPRNPAQGSQQKPPPPLRVKFQVKWRPAKGRDLRLFVIGTISELGQVKLSVKNIKERFNKAVQARFHEWWLVNQQNRTIVRSELSDSEEESDSDDSGGGIDWSKIDRSTAVDLYLDEQFHLLNADEDCGIEDLYTTEYIEITTQGPDHRFSYAFVVWRLDTNTLWDFEVFPEARWWQIPQFLERNPNHRFIIRCERLHDRRETTKYDRCNALIQASRNPCEPMDSDEESSDD